MKTNLLRFTLCTLILLFAGCAACAGNTLSRESGKDPVVLVHGYIGSVLGQLSVEGYWIYYTTRFAIDGYDAYKIALPDAALGDVRTSADRLKDFVADVLRRTGRSKVDIVCHSEGGLVARYYIQNLGGAQYVDDLVTISTPHRGTTVAHIGPGTASRQMEVYNDFLNELNLTNTFPGDIDYTAIFSNNDEIVFPPQNGFFDGAVNVNVNLLGHAGIMVNEDVYRSVKGAISTDIGGGHRAKAIEIQNPSMTTSSRNVTLSIKPFNHHHTDEDMRHMRVSNCPFMSGSDWEGVSSTKSWTLSGSDDGLKAVYVQFRHSGNWLFPKESPVYVDYVFLDRTAPTGGIDIVPQSTLETRVDINISSQDNSDDYKKFKGWNVLVAYGIEDLGVKEMMVSTDPNFAGASWQSVKSSLSLDLGAGSGRRAVYLKLRDGAGNQSRVYSDTVNVIDPIADGLTMVDESVRNPVVLVHGYGGSIVGDVSTYINWVYIYEKLRGEGFDVHRISLGMAALQDIAVSAGELQAFVNNVKSSTGAAKVDIVCHSEGGLVARYYIQNLGGASSVDDLVTISTPHRGSSISSIGPGEAAHQMAVGSDFLDTLNSGDTTPGDVEYTALFSNGDEIVMPGKNGFFDGAVNVNWNLFGHAGILFHPDPYNVMRAAISTRYIHTSDTHPVEILESGMVTSNNALSLKITPYNHYDTGSRQTEMFVSLCPLFQQGAWEALSENKTVSLDGVDDGMLGVHVKFRAAGGNESPSYVDYIVVDRTPPVGSFSIASTDEANNTVTVNLNVNDNSDEFGAVDWTNLLNAYGLKGIGAADMMFSESQDFAGAAWEPIVKTKTISLSAGPGRKTIYARFRDKAGNVSSTVSSEVFIFDGTNGYMAMEQEKNPVVLVHGYMGSIVGDVSAYINWVFYYEKLRTEGFDVSRIAISDGAMQDVKESARELADFVNDVRTRTGADKVDIICHSEGGLIARYYVQKLGGAALTDDLVMISTPHRGTSTAHIGPGEAARQMEIASEFLQYLNRGTNKPGDVDYTAVFSNDDGTVVPAENAFFEGALNINTNLYTHATILFNDEIYEVVKNALLLDVGHKLQQLPVNIEDDDMVTASPQVLVTLNYYNHNDPVSPPAQMMVSNNRFFNGASWQSVSPSLSWTLDTSGDGLKAVYVKFKSDTGAESPAYVDYIVLDRTAPQASVVLQQGADNTSATAVLSATDNTDVYAALSLTHLLESYGIIGLGVQDMMIGTSADLSGAQWEPFADSKTVTFSAGAEKIVYVKLRDKAGNVTDTITAEVPQQTAQNLLSPITFNTLFNMDAGWNLMYIPSALPREIRDIIANITPRSAGRAFDMQQKTFRDMNDTLQSAGAAFWINLPEALNNELSFTLDTASDTGPTQLSLEAGWNIIGHPGFQSIARDDITVIHGADTVSLSQAADAGLLLAKLFEFKDNEYTEVEQMLPFHAYLIRAYRPCILNLP